MKTVCYDIISLANKQPELKTCPRCESELHMEPVQASQDAAAFMQQAGQAEVVTELARCKACDWWAVRERRMDHALYHPPVADLIVLEASGLQVEQPAAKRNRKARAGKAAPWQCVLDDTICWKAPQVISSAEAVQLFGSAQMLLPKLAMPPANAIVERLKSMLPILLPLLVIALIVWFS